MSSKNIIAICATLCVFAILMIIVDSQTKKKPFTKNQINLKTLQNGANRRQNVNNKNYVKGGKKKGKTTNKNKNNKNKGNNNTGNNNNRIKDNGFLSRHNENLVYKSKKVFMSGVNIYYLTPGKDFGNGGYGAVKTQFEAWLKAISDAGGNAVRVFIHADGSTSPMIDIQGYATGEDTASLIQELGQFLDTAQSYNVFAFLTLWFGCWDVAADKLDIFKNDAKLDRYIEKVLKPLVSGLSTKKALGAWDVIYYPQGSVRENVVDSNPCYDTQNLFHKHTTTTFNNLTMKEMLKFINKQFDAIKIADQKALRSVTSNEEEASEYCDWCYNYWQDKCLITAGGKSNGVLDFYGFDGVSWLGYDYYWSPLKKKLSDYKLGKPIIIATSSGTCSDSKSGVTNFNNALSSSYAGIFNYRYSTNLDDTFCSDSTAQIDASMNAIKKNDIVKISMQ